MSSTDDDADGSSKSKELRRSSDTSFLFFFAAKRKVQELLLLVPPARRVDIRNAWSTASNATKTMVDDDDHFIVRGTPVAGGCFVVDLENLE